MNGCSISNTHYANIAKEYRKGFGLKGDVSIVPLMMNIFFMFEQKKCVGIGMKKREFDPKRFVEKAARMKASMAEGVRQPGVRRGKSEGHNAYTLYARLEQNVAKRFDKYHKKVMQIKTGKGFTEKLRSLIVPRISGEIEVSPGYLKHAKDLIALQRRNRGKVFPFFAVDPRRKGIMEMITTGKPFLCSKGKLVSKDGPFYGIKFYPRLGYLPDDESDPDNGRFLDVVDYCIESDLPVVTHAGPDGFPPLELFPNWPYEQYSNPIHWDNLMKKERGGLTINLAHFGYCIVEWRNTILYCLLLSSLCRDLVFVRIISRKPTTITVKCLLRR